MNGHQEIEAGIHFALVLLVSIFVLLLCIQGTLIGIWRRQWEISVCVHFHDGDEDDDAEEDWGEGEPNAPSED